MKVLHSIAQQRGIYYSATATRDELVTAISRLNFDYQSRQNLLSQAAIKGHQEKVTSSSVTTALSSPLLMKTVQALKQDLEKGGDIVSVTQTQDSKIEVNVEYNEMDFSKTRLKQKIEKEAKIELSVEGETVKIRRPSNNKANNAVNNLIQKIGNFQNKKIVEEKVDLSEILNPKLRTEFFIELFRKLTGFILVDVYKIKVNRLAIGDSDTEDEDLIKAESELSGIVTKATIEGQGLLFSPEFDRLNADGFYICGGVWIAEVILGHDRVTFDIGFENPKECTGFHFKIGRIYAGPTTKDGKHRLRPPLAGEIDKYQALIEEESIKAYNKVCNKVKAKPIAKLNKVAEK